MFMLNVNLNKKSLIIYSICFIYLILLYSITILYINNTLQYITLRILFLCVINNINIFKFRISNDNAPFSPEYLSSGDFVVFFECL